METRSQSIFSTYPKKTLVKIASEIIDKGFDSTYNFSSENIDADWDENFAILKNISKYVAIKEINSLDVQFFIKFLNINDDLLSKIFDPNGDKSLIDQLVIPQAKEYTFNYETWGTCTYNEDHVDKTYSYDEKWVKQSVKLDEYEGYWDTWEGESLDTHYDDHEQSNWDITSVHETYHNPKDKLNTESLLNRLVLENTNEVITSLDKKTLIKLRNIIESRLRSI
jgi:hypothetical protein